VAFVNWSCNSPKAACQTFSGFIGKEVSIDFIDGPVSQAKTVLPGAEPRLAAEKGNKKPKQTPI
jgi:hypothetical protein